MLNVIPQFILSATNLTLKKIGLSTNRHILSCICEWLCVAAR